MAKNRNDLLRTYRRKRDFSRTSEPQEIVAESGRKNRKASKAAAGRKASKTAGGAKKGRSGNVTGRLKRAAGRTIGVAPAAAELPASQSHRRVFVVQLHRARRLHFDFRLEVEEVLASWAVPKAPSTDPHDRRLAVKVEDHPLEYASFEGTIPEGGYGAGAVIVWDGGVYDNLRRDPDGGEVPMSQAIEDGHVEVFLEGRKLRGAYAPTRIGDSVRHGKLAAGQRCAIRTRGSRSRASPMRGRSSAGDRSMRWRGSPANRRSLAKSPQDTPELSLF